MALAAADSLDLDLTSSWVVGDRDADIGLARAVGARALRVGGTGQPTADVIDLPDLAAAVEFILADDADRSATPKPSFPADRFQHAGSFTSAYAAELDRALASIEPDAVHAAAEMLNDAYGRDAAVFVCGNGGSASIANHLQCDHVKGIRTGTELNTRVISLACNMELFSAIANDNGYENVFEFQLQSMARPGDLVLVVSSSGRSPNVIRALEFAARNGLKSIALTGFSGGRSAELADVSVHVRSDNYGIVEDAHQACMHLLAQFVRQSHLSDAAIAAATF